MKILVPIKHVVDYRLNIQVKADGSGINTDKLKKSMNPFDAIALEQALRLKESDPSHQVIALSAGAQEVCDSLTEALACGADRALHIVVEDSPEPLQLAHWLKVIVEREAINLVLMGKQSIDGDNNQTPQMLAGLLDWPQATFISSLSLVDDHCQLTREVDEGLQQLQVKMPAVLSCDLRLNTPRYPSLPAIMRAKKMPIDKIIAADLAAPLKLKTHVLKVEPTPIRPKGIKVEDVKELVEKLKDHAGVL